MRPAPRSPAPPGISRATRAPRCRGGSSARRAAAGRDRRGAGAPGPAAERIEAQARQHAPERRLEVVAAGVLEVMLRVGVALQQLLIAGRELVLHRAKLGLELGEMGRRAAGMGLDGALDVDEQLLLQ